MTFAQQFAKLRGKAIDYEGRLITAMHRVPATASSRFVIRRVASISQPVQGISLSIQGGSLKVAGTVGKDFVLWSDTSPEFVEIECVAKGACELQVWNCWRGDRDAIFAWVGNAAMLVATAESDPSTTILRCNSRPEITFEDLIFNINPLG